MPPVPANCSCSPSHVIVTATGQPPPHAEGISGKEGFAFSLRSTFARIMNARKRTIGICDQTWSALLVAAGAAVRAPFR